MKPSWKLLRMPLLLMDDELLKNIMQEIMGFRGDAALNTEEVLLDGDMELRRCDMCSQCD